MATFRLEIATPESRIFDADVEAVTLPVDEGEIQVLPGHIPLLTRLVPGPVEVTLPGGQAEYLALGEGFARVTPGHVALLCGAAVHARDVDEIEAEEARRKAEARLQEQISDAEYAAVSATLAHAAARLHVKRRQGATAVGRQKGRGPGSETGQ
jgi:F-type H+-transporting ATPase subunit epsilon